MMSLVTSLKKNRKSTGTEGKKLVSTKEQNCRLHKNEAAGIVWMSG